MVLSRPARYLIVVLFAALAWWLDPHAGTLLLAKGGKTPSVPKPIPPPTPADPAAQHAAADASRAAAIKSGAFGDVTIATSPLGSAMPGAGQSNAPQLRGRLG